MRACVHVYAYACVRVCVCESVCIVNVCECRRIIHEEERARRVEVEREGQINYSETNISLTVPKQLHNACRQNNVYCLLVSEMIGTKMCIWKMCVMCIPPSGVVKLVSTVGPRPPPVIAVTMTTYTAYSSTSNEYCVSMTASDISFNTVICVAKSIPTIEMM